MDNISSRFERQGNLSIKANYRDIPLGGWLHMHADDERSSNISATVSLVSHGMAN